MPFLPAKEAGTGESAAPRIIQGLNRPDVNIKPAKGLSYRQPAPVHHLPDSERLLKTHGAWRVSWDATAQQEEEAAFNGLLEAVFNWYASGLLPVQVSWRLAQQAAHLPARERARIQRAAEKALCAAETAPPELRRAMVAATRQRAIQGALADGEWSAALRGLDRAGEIAGELRESAGLGEEDLRLVVSIEAPVPELSHSSETGETASETEGETDSESQ